MCVKHRGMEKLDFAGTFPDAFLTKNFSLINTPQLTTDEVFFSSKVHFFPSLLDNKNMMSKT